MILSLPIFALAQTKNNGVIEEKILPSVKIIWNKVQAIKLSSGQILILVSKKHAFLADKCGDVNIYTRDKKGETHHYLYEVKTNIVLTKITALTKSEIDLPIFLTCKKDTVFLFEVPN